MSWFRPPAVFLVGDVYYFEVQFDHRRIKRSTRKKTKREAQAVADFEWAKLRRAADDRLMAQGKLAGSPADMRLETATHDYWEGHLKHLADPDAIWRRITRLNDIIGRKTLITDISDKTISRYVTQRRAYYESEGIEGIAAIRADLANLRRILIHSRDIEKLPVQNINWKAHLKNLPARVRDRVLTSEEKRRVFEAIRPDFLPIIKIKLATGIRLQALCDLKWSDIKDDAISYVQKGNRPHEVPIERDVHAILNELRSYARSEDDPVFSFVAERTYTNPKTGKRFVQGERYPILSQNLKTRWARLRQTLSDMPIIVLHDLRRTFLTDFYAVTGNVKATAAAAGHASDQIIMKHYVPRIDGAQKRASRLVARARHREEVRLRRKTDKKVAAPVELASESPVSGDAFAAEMGLLAFA